MLNSLIKGLTATVIFCGLFITFLISAHAQGEGFISMQRLLIAKQLGTEPGFLRVDRSPSIIQHLSDDGKTAHIVGSYRTRIMKEDQPNLTYQMHMSYEPQRDLYLVKCFRLLDEINEGEKPCF